VSRSNTLYVFIFAKCCLPPQRKTLLLLRSWSQATAKICASAVFTFHCWTWLTRVDLCVQIQVAHFETSFVSVKGEGVFPRISLDLPRFTGDDERYASLVKEARENLERDTIKRDRVSRASTPQNQNRDNEYETSHHFPANVVSDNCFLLQSSGLCACDSCWMCWFNCQWHVVSWWRIFSIIQVLNTG